ncbi:MAG TPA: PHB depolymerase family esterase [Actinokineospora sp.]|nr:PHB depolymerase family esterase [Actinokineospora sp.]
MSVRHPLAALLAALTLLVTFMIATGRPAHAAAIEEVTGFGSNPGDLRMFRYVPAGLPAARPLVVVLHGCTQDAAGYGVNSGWTRLADANGFALALPQQKPANNANSCFNWFEPGDTARGSGEALSIRQMVDRMRTDVGSASAYVTGLSAGGAMTAVMLATYPDVFAGGGVVAGIPYRCATTVSAAFNCMSPGVGLTPAQWGDKVRAAFSHTGPRPKVSIWHGTADTTVKPVNGVELVDQWTNVLGTDQTPEVSDTVGGYPHRVYGSVVESFDITGMNHGQPVDPGSGPAQCGTAAAYILDVNVCAAHHIARFWGLTGGAEPTTTTAPPTTTPPPGVCHTDHNYGHVAAGRAHTAGGYVYANGSNQAMGLYNTFARHTLKETPPGYFVVADTGCP